MHKSEAVKNIIAIINQEYTTSFRFDLSNADFDNIFPDNYSIISSGQLASLIIDVEFSKEYDFLKEFKSYLKLNNLNFISQDNGLKSIGFWILQGGSMNSDIDNFYSYRIRIGKKLLKDHFDNLITDFVNKKSHFCGYFRVRIIPEGNITIDWHFPSQAEKFYNTEISLVDEFRYSYKGVEFTFVYDQVSEDVSDISFDFISVEGIVTLEWITSLTDLLFENNILISKY